ncbi:LysR substrate-binding domain-containing protein [Streptomyces bluensis]|uniref:LysR substrate-binding domain-containing protein n=1 Tax=Streptomyces bluensis TaxID=33897 RepID=UPI0033200B4A
MELRQLRYFVAAAEELHFTRAAARLGIAQPALSQQIRRLEAALGVELFSRTRRQVTLTPAGRAFLAEARGTLEQARRAARIARRTAAGELGPLTIGFVGSATDALLPRALPTLRARHPELKLVLRELTSAEQIDALARGGIDLGLLRPPSPLPPGLRTRLVAREPLVCALPADHPLTRHERLTATDLHGQPFVLFPRREGPWLYDLITAYCRGADGTLPTVVQEAVMMQTITALVAAGTGISLVPASQQAISREGLTYRPLADPPLTDLSAAWPSTGHNPARDAVLNALTGTVNRGP